MLARGKALWPRNAFGRAVSVLVGGTAFAQLLGVLAAPVLTRLYSPEDFGLLGAFASILAVIGVVQTLRYSLAIPLPARDDEAAHVALLSLLVAASIVAIVVAAVPTVGDSLLGRLGLEQLGGYLWLLPLALIFQAIYDVFSYWSIRTGAFVGLARTKIVQVSSAVATQLVLAGAGAFGLIVGSVAGSAAGSVGLALGALRTKRAHSFLRPRLMDVWRSAIRYRRFPLYSSWGGLFNTLGSHLPPVLFVSLFNPNAAGMYVLTHRVLSLPMQLLGKALADVFLSRAAEAHRTGTLAPLVLKVHATLAAVSMPAVVLVIVLGPFAFSLAFGDEWVTAGHLARWMAPWLYLVFVTSPLSSLFSVLELQSQGAAFQGILLVTRVGAIAMGASTGDVVFTVALFSIGSAACWLGFLVWVAKVSGNRRMSFVVPTTRSLVVTLGVVAPVAVAMALGSWFAPAIALTSALLVLYYLHAWKDAVA